MLLVTAVYNVLYYSYLYWLQSEREHGYQKLNDVKFFNSRFSPLKTA